MDERNDLNNASPEMLEALDLVEKSHLLIQNDEYDAAEELLKKAEEIEPMCGRIYLERGGLLVMRGIYPAAIEEYKRSLLINPEDGETLYMMANTNLLLNEFDQAISSYKKAEKSGYESMHMLNNLGYCLEQKGKYDDALVYYQKAIDKYPEWEAPYLRRIGCLTVMRKITQAEEEAQKAVEIFPTIPGCWEELARLYRAQFKFIEAEKVLKDAAERFPNHLGLKIMLLENCIALNREDEVKKIGAEVRSVEGMPPEILSRIDKAEGAEYFRAEKIDNAIECYERCVERDTPENPDLEARNVLLTIYRVRKMYPKMQALAADCQKTSRASDELCSAYAMEAIAADEMGHKEEATALYREAIRQYMMISIKQRSRVDTHVYRVMCHLGLNELDKAKEELDYVERVAGANGGTKELRAQLLRAEGKTAEADAMEAEFLRTIENMKRGLQDGE